MQYSTDAAIFSCVHVLVIILTHTILMQCNISYTTVLSSDITTIAWGWHHLVDVSPVQDVAEDVQSSPLNVYMNNSSQESGKTACDSFKEKERLFRKYFAKCHSNIAQIKKKNTMSWCLSFTHCCPKGARLLRAWHNVQAANSVQGISIHVSL